MERRVRYYHHRFEPSYFRNRGWRGLLVRLLNWLRWKFEVWATYHAMILLALDHMGSLANEGSTKKEVVEALKLRFEEDRKEARRPRGVLRAFGVPAVEQGPADSRYAEGRKNVDWSDQTSRQNLARTIANAQRKSAYTVGRDTLLIQEVEAEPVEGSQEA